MSLFFEGAANGNNLADMPFGGGKDSSSPFNGALQSYTGADIQSIFYLPNENGIVVPKVVGTLASITVSAVREVAPQYTMGSTDFRSVSRGKRSVSGTMTFTVFDRDPLVRDIIAAKTTEALSNQYKDLVNYLSMDASSGWVAASSDKTELIKAMTASRNLQKVIGRQPMRYADQLAPFDITITFANDQMSASVAAIRQVYIVSQGIGWSSHDMETDAVYSYIARYFEPLTPVNERRAKLPQATLAGIPGTWTENATIR